MVVHSLVTSHRVLVRCLCGDVLVGWEDMGVGMALYKFGVVQLGGDDVQ